MGCQHPRGTIGDVPDFGDGELDRRIERQRKLQITPGLSALQEIVNGNQEPLGVEQDRVICLRSWKSSEAFISLIRVR
jgi:hypothetical protein